MIHFWHQVYNFCRQTTQRIAKQLLIDFGQLEAIQKSRW